MTFERIDDADERDLGWPDVAAAAGLLVLVLAFVAVLVWG